MAKITEAAAEFRLKEVFVTAITTALGLVVALTWNDAIQNTINTLIPPGEGLYYKYLAALVVTAGAVIAIYMMYRIQKANIVPDVFEERLRLQKKKLKGKIVRKKK